MNDDRLRELLTDAVSDVEPQDRIEELRASVRPSPRLVKVLHARPWYAAAAIVAGVIGVVAFVTSVAGNNSAEPGFSTHGGSSGPSTVIATDTSAPSPSADAEAPQLTVFYLGDGPRGDVLFRETVPAGADPLSTAVSALMATPQDPDYRTAWRPGSLLSARMKHGVVEVELGATRARRPDGMSARTADEIVQQAVYTFQAASGHRDAKVQFLRHHEPARTVLGVSTERPVAPGPVYEVLSLMNITSPTEGEGIERGPFEVTGLNNSAEANVVVEVVRTSPTGDLTVLTESGTASGTGDLNRLYPWRVRIDTTDLSPGTYTLVASNGQMASEGEGLPPAKDTRTIVLR